MKDALFDVVTNTAHAPFEFNRKVADVFDDMIARSVPAYDHLQSVICDLVTKSVPASGTVYDLGCSTGTTLNNIAHQAKSPLRLVGIDNSQAMLDRCQAKMNGHHCHEVLLRCEDIRGSSCFSDGHADVVILSLVLQFLRPLERLVLLKNAFGSMRPGALLVIVEKIVPQDGALKSLFVDCYQDMKRQNGYSDNEIVQKRQALENVLIPFYRDENLSLIVDAGFNPAEVFFAVLPFQGYVAFKRGAA